ncbi:MAG: glutamine synthetase III [Saprospiraceae bacterium]|nr:glutamine synthetase III [Saprospiraceae bacterium]
MNSRFNALDLLSTRENIQTSTLTSRVPEIFGCNVFNDVSIERYLAPKLYKEFKLVTETGSSLSRDLADHVAEAMKKWALEKGVTHYAHWFQPLTGRTAEKHDSFFTLNSNGEAIEEFTGNELVQQEPDGSSFPGGGLRSTFEARGYTAWDPTSPAFILDIFNQKTLCIPTIFVTYGGQALDYKLPLLKSQSYLEKSAIDVCKLFDENIKKIFVTLGWEQEFFLVDEALFNVRPDLIMTGRTLLGRLAPKGQQLDDHYFGSIPERVYAYMTDLEQECYKLGIPLRTRHNEVAPSQYEFAPIYEDVNVAVDHNQLLMDLMERVAIRHKLRVLFHEKPYAGINGSGKHNNWSVATNTGKNLLSPGKDPGKNLQFLTFFVNTIYAVYKYADILRASVTSASNDHRLGANEAPPAIISVFVGEALTKILNEIEKGIDVTDDGVKQALSLLSKIPNLQLDNTDRNRTSPFAFTGNKFEIRMVGSTMNCAAPMTIMNMIVGKQLKEFSQDVQILMANNTTKNQAILTVLKHYITESKPIRFEGDGYSQDWKEEAERRGLGNYADTPRALDAFSSDSTKALFVETGIMSEEELHAHYEVRLEAYALKLQIESRTMAEMCLNQIIPAAVNYQNSLIENILSLKELNLQEKTYRAQLDLVEDISSRITIIKDCAYKMKKERKKANSLDTRDKAFAYCDNIIPIMEELRTAADQLEPLIDDELWPLIKYREMLFLR